MLAKKITNLTEFSTFCQNSFLHFADLICRIVKFVEIRKLGLQKYIRNYCRFSTDGQYA